jgi:hypothetical protein
MRTANGGRSGGGCAAEDVEVSIKSSPGNMVGLNAGRGKNVFRNVFMKCNVFS